MTALPPLPPADPFRFAATDLTAQVGQRLDVIVAQLAQRPRTWARARIEAGGVQIPGRAGPLEPSDRLRGGESLQLDRATTAPPEPPLGRAPQAEAIALDLLYEDEALLALNKPPRLVVHPAAGHRAGTLVNALLHHCGPALAQRGGEERVGLVHRLDQDTSGVIVVAKTERAHERLAAAFAERRVEKTYRALCWGRFRQTAGELQGAIGRHPLHRKKMAVRPEGGRAAHTSYKVLHQGLRGAEVACRLHTGRTHQIRVHLAATGHPVWGDALYGRHHPLPGGFFPPRQMLHAYELRLAHPSTGIELAFTAPFPPDYLEARSHLLGFQPRHRGRNSSQNPIG